jgi:DNA topoisomerase II
VDDTTILITELPIKKWTQTYKEFLEAMLVGDSKTPPEIKDLKENHTETTVSFTVIAAKEKIDEWAKDSKGGLYGKFKLTASLSTSNMTLFDEEARITKYDTPEDIVCAFYKVRLEFYDKRKANLIRNLEAEKKTLSNKARFVEEVCSGELVVSNRKRKDLLEELQQRGFDLIAKDSKTTDKANDGEDGESDSEEDETSTADLAKGFEYLLGMKIWSLTYEKAEQLRSQLEEKTKELEDLQATDPSQIWSRDLDAIEVALDERDQALFAAEVDERRAQKKNKTRNAKKKAIGKKKKKDEWDSDVESDSDDEKMDIGSDSDDELFTSTKPVVVKKIQAAPAVKAVAKNAPIMKRTVAPAKASSSVITKSQEIKRPPTPPPSDSEDEFGLGESLIDRMKKKLVVSPPPKKKPLTESNDSKKRPSPRMDEPTDDSDFDFKAEEVKPKPLKAKKPATTSKVAVKKPAAKEAKAAAKKKPSKAAPRKKAASFDEDTDSADDFDFQSDDEASGAALPARARPARATTAKQPTVYSFSSDSDEDFE